MIYKSPYPDRDLPDLPLTEVVLHRTEELSDKPAMIDGPGQRTFTYGQLAKLTQQLTAGLIQHGFNKGDVFAIYMPNTLNRGKISQNS